MTTPLYQPPQLRLEVTFPDGTTTGPQSVIAELNQPVSAADVGVMVAQILAAARPKPATFTTNGGAVTSTHAFGQSDHVRLEVRGE